MDGPFYTDLTFWMYLLPGLLNGAFVGLYAVRTPTWRNNPVGRALMTQAVSLTAVFAFVCLLLAVDVPDDVKDMLRALLLGGITFAAALMLRELRREQAKQRSPQPCPKRRSTDYP